MRLLVYVLGTAITFAVVSLPGQPLTINSLSAVELTALTPLYISTTGIDPSGVPVVVKFSDNLGFSITEQPLRIVSDGTVVVAVPLYIDPISHATGSGSVSVTLTQGEQSTPPYSITIQDLPSVSSYGLQPGDISHSFLVFTAMAIGAHLNEYQALQIMPGNTVDTTAAQLALNSLLKAIIAARRDVDNVSVNNSLTISSGTLPDGTPIQFDQQSLDIMDRMIGLYLTELAPVITSGTASTSIQAVDTRREFPQLSSPTSNGDRSWTSSDASFIGQALLAIITNATNLTSIAQAEQAYFKSDALWSDKVLAVGGGLATVLGASWIPPFKEVGLATGAVVGMASIASDITVELTDLAAMYFASYPGTPPLLEQTAYDDLHSTNGKLLLDTFQTEFALAAAGSGAGFLGSFGAGLVGTLESGIPASVFQGASLIMNIVQLKFGDQLQVAADASLQQVLNPITSITQGIADLTGTVTIQNYYLGIKNVPSPSGVNVISEVSVSSNGNAFSTIADPNGHYNMLVPLQVDPFVYSKANLQILDPSTQGAVTVIDPSSGETVTSLVIDLSALTTVAPLQLPTIGALVDCYQLMFDAFAQCDATWPALTGPWGSCVSASYSLFWACWNGQGGKSANLPAGQLKH